MAEYILKLAERFSPYPAGRYRSDGKLSGEVFRDDFLLPLYKEHGKINICIDDVATLPSSFWEEVWGGLVRLGYSKEEVKENFSASTNEAELEDYIALVDKFIKEAKKG